MFEFIWEFLILGVIIKGILLREFIKWSWVTFRYFNDKTNPRHRAINDHYIVSRHESKNILDCSDTSCRTVFA